MKARAGRSAAAAILILLGVSSIGLFVPHLQLVLVAIGFLGYVHYGSRAMTLWHADDRVFRREPPRIHRLAEAHSSGEKR